MLTSELAFSMALLVVVDFGSLVVIIYVYQTLMFTFYDLLHFETVIFQLQSKLIFFFNLYMLSKSVEVWNQSPSINTFSFS